MSTTFTEFSVSTLLNITCWHYLCENTQNSTAILWARWLRQFTKYWLCAAGSNHEFYGRVASARPRLIWPIDRRIIHFLSARWWIRPHQCWPCQAYKSPSPSHKDANSHITVLQLMSVHFDWMLWVCVWLVIPKAYYISSISIKA